jgi:phosphatidylserine/phosphatidylglycerophosphate/cardiolipin synthase-like enzyme
VRGPTAQLPGVPISVRRIDDEQNAMTRQLTGYLADQHDVPMHVDDTEWVPLVDGVAYLTELDAELRAAEPGDTVLMTGLEIDPDIDLAGRVPGADGYLPLGRQLAELAARGVDVRVLVAGRVVASSIPWSGLGPFRANAGRMQRLRDLRVGDAQPLARAVLLDFAGAPLGSNHQKTVVTHVRGRLTAFVAGIDLVEDRFDDGGHDRLRHQGQRWGWHDMAVRLRGPAARRVWEIFRERWVQAAALPDKAFFRTPWERRRLNPIDPLPQPGPGPHAAPVSSPGTRMQILRSTYRRHQQVHATLVAAIGAARRYIYIEDQYLGEELGGVADYELYPHLRAALYRGVKVIMVGSGVRDPGDPGVHLRPINRSLNADLSRKLVGPLPDELRRNVAVYRLERCTVHAKLTLVDDVFANIGSANMFSRSMAGVDSEMTVAVETTTSAVRDLRVAVWGEHLRTATSDSVRSALADLDLALGIWRPGWLAAGTPAGMWRTAGMPEGFSPLERMLTLVGPED